MLDSLREEEIRKANENIEKLISDGAPIVKMDIFDTLDKYVPSERVINSISYTMELYFELIDKIKELSDEDQIRFLNTLKKADVIDNQKVEAEDSFLISLYMAFENGYAVDELLSLKDNTMTKDEFINIHDKILTGTSSEKRKGLRENNLKYVGRLSDNPTSKYHIDNREISYFPIRYTDIDKAIDRFLGYYNGINNVDETKALIIPIIYHGLIASLQLFNDGNTRFGRLFQNVLMFRFINKAYNIDLPLPIVYATRQYEGYRNKYRALVESLVVDNNNEAWDNWIKFNLDRIEDGIMYNEMCIDKLENFEPRGR